jgi:hypothetical protein
MINISHFTTRAYLFPALLHFFTLLILPFILLQILLLNLRLSLIRILPSSSCSPQNNANLYSQSFVASHSRVRCDCEPVCPYTNVSHELAVYIFRVRMVNTNYEITQYIISVSIATIWMAGVRLAARVRFFCSPYRSDPYSMGIGVWSWSLTSI